MFAVRDIHDAVDGFGPDVINSNSCTVLLHEAGRSAEDACCHVQFVFCVTTLPPPQQSNWNPMEDAVTIKACSVSVQHSATFPPSAPHLATPGL
jgi:hypothetical protein